MSQLYASKAFLPTGWTRNVQLTLKQGKIAAISSEVPPEQAAGERHDILLPAMPNLHSHAFQRAMAGLTETRGDGDDSFWSWRTLMYRFALSMTPDQMEAVAAQLYMEMLEAGFGRVGEFHYLHHDKDGNRYSNIAEMAERIAAAANDTGIALTLLPVFYAHSGFGAQAPGKEQRRFINSVEGFAQLTEAAAKSISSLPNSRIGIAPHSLRAATVDEIRQILPVANGGPIHIHVAEQTKEVEDCISFCGARPIEYLLSNFSINDTWCLIHATHMTAEETAAVAKAGAVAGLCPITEANLGDGIFPITDFLKAGGSFGIGSDSNVLIAVSDELRQLEYSQRLAQRARNVIAPPNGSTGQTLYEKATMGGSAALAATAKIAQGEPADLVSYDLHRQPKQHATLDHIIFAGAPKPDCVWVHGAKQVAGGRHRDRDRIERRFRTTLDALMA
ncbi:MULTISPECIES: formimidoylglutamate deiminase [unclassified Ensifer]|uniref:formimidoylglutamate deiminase n=1 Tax=unclassified Ensifer TaxID=2633371 RepID=UPI00177DAC6A|nr:MULTISPECIES: formimidoylglutamate deiminase [unclassified Ensifer]MBD9499017.1 formimidoylglutamate deiminase [Ensifer sp. ENS01]MBD9561024.1 formimidoylglutamate deiminase [Ensifer sp. ENS03]